MTSSSDFPASDASWIALNEVVPSGANAAKLSIEMGLAGAKQ
jgi:hypothetical protein